MNVNSTFMFIPMRRFSLIIFVVHACLSLAAPAFGTQENEPAEKKETTTVVTVYRAQTKDLQILEKSIGWVESISAPQVVAEVEGRVLQVFADTGQHVKAGELLAKIDDEKYRYDLLAGQADIKRLEALIDFQERSVKRLLQLYGRKAASLDKKEQAESQLATFKALLSAAQARTKDLERLLKDTEVISPVTGRVDNRHISVGDYVKVANPLFDVFNDTRLRVYLPFPEAMTSQLKPGLQVLLTTPLFPDTTFKGKIKILRPAIQSASRAVIALIDIDIPEGWRPGASVNGTIIVGRHPGAVVVPESCVVRRPVGEVVYVIRDDQAHEQVVTTGERQEGLIEIRTGLQEGIIIAADGAGFLSDLTAVRIREEH